MAATEAGAAPEDGAMADGATVAICKAGVVGDVDTGAAADIARDHR